MATIQAVILAAGAGARLGRGPKALVRFLGLRLVERAVLTLREAGVDEFVIVVGAGGDATRDAILSSPRLRGVPLRIVPCDEWARGNGVSALAAMEFVRSPFLVAMADHIFAPTVIRRLLQASPPAMLVDSSPPDGVVAEATKVRIEAGRVAAAGKDLPGRTVDAGLVLCDESIAAALRETISERETEWNAAYPRARPWAVDIAGSFWADVDTPDDFRAAERAVLRSLTKASDGPVSRYLNRPVSTRISKAIVGTSVTANQISVAVFLLYAVSAALFASGERPWLFVAGVIVQAASILDGTDGEVARLRFETSKFGAWFDATLDRYGDALVVLGMAIALPALRPDALALAAAALFGSLLVSYTAARYEADFREPAPFTEGAVIPAKRDTRSLIAMAGGVLGAVFPALVLIAVLTNAEVVRRVVRVARLGGR